MADLSVFVGQRVILRQPVPTDLEARLEVPADPELHRMYGGSGAPGPVTREGVEAGLEAIRNQDVTKVRWFVIAATAWPDGMPVDGREGRYIGHVRLTPTSAEDRRARLALGIYDRRFWSCGYGTEAIRLMLRYGFVDVGLHRIDLRVLEYNGRAIRASEKCGFVREGVERESACIEGVWHSDVMMSILEGEYHAQSWARTDGGPAASHASDRMDGV